MQLPGRWGMQGECGERGPDETLICATLGQHLQTCPWIHGCCYCASCQWAWKQTWLSQAAKVYVTFMESSESTHWSWSPAGEGVQELHRELWDSTSWKGKFRKERDFKKHNLLRLLLVFLVCLWGFFLVVVAVVFFFFFYLSCLSLWLSCYEGI